ncbi:MobA/MobL family protein [Qipengyuania sp. YIM B01966]|uniref:MobA/MobL family protein n=1 Tax=Qipengyuania sp. YIM B01966 TaxID=2778646 RepID=UPI0018F31A94|nr:MobA/MobL family protein [Qipengyuania sp. YIM B01966]
MKEQSHLPPPFSVAAELRALEAKVNAYIDAGTIDATGVPLQPKPPAPSTKLGKTGSAKKGPADAVLARRSLLGIFERRIADGLPRDTYITGQVGGKPIIARARVGELDWTDDEITIVHQKGNVLAQRTRLPVPIVRNIKAVSTTGIETIHFKVTWIVKQPSQSGKDGDVDQRASSHTIYIEREGAVVIVVEPEMDKVDAAKPIENQSQNAARSATEADPYIDRDEVVPVAVNGRKLLYTNISDDPHTRALFWRAVEKHERDPGVDRMTLDLGKCGLLMKKVAQAPDCPPKFVEEFYKIVGKTGPQTIETGSNDMVIEIMRAHGEDVVPEFPKKGEPKFKKEDRLEQFGYSFTTPRHGRVQYRIEAALPSDLSIGQMEQVLAEMCAMLEKIDLPYVAVIHKPDHNNHDDNWHIHILFHDQPAKLFTGLETDHLAPLRANASEKEIEEHERLRRVLRDAADEKISEPRWDFEIEENFFDTGRHPRTRKPFAQNKVREVNHPSYITELRKAYAGFCNDQLRIAGSHRKVSHLGFEDLKIDRKPAEKLYTAATRLERFGVPTTKGIENERHEAQYCITQIRNGRDKALVDLEAKTARWRARSLFDNAAPSRARYDATIDTFENGKRAAIDKRFMADFIELQLERCASRARAVIDNCSRILRAIADGEAAPKDVRQRLAYLKRRTEAEAHLAATERHFSSEYQRVEVLRMEAKQEALETDALGWRIDDAQQIETAIDCMALVATSAVTRYPDMLEAVAKLRSIDNDTILPDLGDAMERWTSISELMRERRESDAAQAPLQEPSAAVAEETPKPALKTDIAVDNVGKVDTGRSGGPAVSEALSDVEMGLPAVEASRSASTSPSPPVPATQSTDTQEPQPPILRINPAPASRPAMPVSLVSPAAVNPPQTQLEIGEVAPRPVQPKEGPLAVEPTETERPTTAAAVGRPIEPDSRPNPSQTQRAETPSTDAPHAPVSGDGQAIPAPTRTTTSPPVAGEGDEAKSVDAGTAPDEQMSEKKGNVSDGPQGHAQEMASSNTRAIKPRPAGGSATDRNGIVSTTLDTAATGPTSSIAAAGGGQGAATAASQPKRRSKLFDAVAASARARKAEQEKLKHHRMTQQVESSDPPAARDPSSPPSAGMGEAMPAAPSDLRDPNRQRSVPDTASPQLGMPGLGDEVSPEPLHVPPSKGLTALEEVDEHTTNHPAPRDEAFDKEAERVRIANTRLGSRGKYIERKWGLNDFIDAWIDADIDGDDAALLQALADVRADPAAHEIAAQFVPYHLKQFDWLDAVKNAEQSSGQQAGDNGRRADLSRDRGRDITDT